MKQIYVYVLDTMADWEIAYVMPALKQEATFNHGAQRYQLKTVGLSKDPIVSAGGLTIVPDCSIAEMADQQAAALILPGADTWHEETHHEIVDKAVKYAEQGVLVAGICGATLALANAGLLDDRRHTSSALEFLKGASAVYQGAAHYQTDLAVLDQGIITASPAGALAFARAILAYLEIVPTAMLDAWFNFYQTGEAKYYLELMALMA